MIRYVLGFLFDPTGRVALLRKDHGPGEMAGKLNGIGGHVHDGEIAQAAMNHGRGLLPERKKGRSVKKPMHSIHRSIDYARVEHDRANYDHTTLEVAFADVWEEENRPRPGVNFSHGILQDLMMNQRDYLGSSQARLIITRRDAAVAATAVQWLGTNCGRGFLHSVFKRASYRLLEVGAVEHEQQVMRHEQQLREQARDLAKLSADLAAEGALLAQQRREIAEGQANFLALMLTANRRVFQRTEIVTVPRRLIRLDGE